ncbi:heavy metal sensor histidine kinase [Caballeronia sp. LZ032]|uniref:heavy metal sensor histidine kinase n=1 Tax=Caballeronia sp. LZ032 TaxID=3038565 RepID=UPI002860EB23|nr:heavy metal sensor histidine kinase [Caballeronia sp. LZ032]MDR5880528.1 heavy metal sensor histidine kinase [Caballeronia sp. LZ032]
MNRVPAVKSPYVLLVRLTVAFAVAALLVFSLMGAYLYRSLAHELERRDDVEISGKLAQFRQLLTDAGSFEAVRRDQSVFREVLLSHPGVYLAILGERRELLAHHGSKTVVEFQTLLRQGSLPGVPYSCKSGAIGDARCVSASQKLRSGEVAQVLLSRSALDRQSLLQSYRIDILLAVAIGSLLVGALGYLITRRGLVPVKSIGRQASRIEAHNLSDRLDIDGGPVELQEIASSVNRMLDRLERAFVRLSQFSSDLAHDMRTPLATLLSASQITLSRTRTIDEYEALIESNIEEYEQLQRLIENMLFLARTDNAQQVLNVSEINAESELGRLASYFQGLADESNIRITVQGSALVEADTGLFRRAVSNLVSNALEHATPDSTVELRALQTPQHASVEVVNCGKVIAPEHLGKIFERFYRADASRHGSAKNTGLGLAIVKSIMQLHRGTVDVESAAGRTAFSLRFPRNTLKSSKTQPT